MFTLLHTSDWHLGRQLYGQPRDAEFQAWLEWLEHCLQQQNVDALLIAGDVFDTLTPSHRAQQLYYHFLAKVASRHLCRHIIIIGGNHDSASFLNAPKTLLSALNVHVIGAKTEPLSDELIVLQDAAGQVQALVCAVPYLRDRDVRLSHGDETMADKNLALLTGISQHYQQLRALAADKQATLPQPVPLIAMGHLFTHGGQTVAADGVRELYVGSLAHVDAHCFDGFDYVALGHLHVPQCVAAQQHIRYCGSPIAMGFGEAAQQKQVLHVAFTGRLPTVTAIAVPCFHPLERIAGDMAHIQTRLQQLIAAASHAYVEIVYQGDTLISDLAERIAALSQDSDVRVLRIENRQLQRTLLQPADPQLALAELTPDEVFTACLQHHAIPAAQQLDLRASYQQVLQSLLSPEDEAI